MNKLIVFSLCALLAFSEVGMALSSQKGMVIDFDLESGSITLSTGKFFLSDKLKVQSHDAQLNGNELLEKGQFIEFWLMEQKNKPKYFSSKENIITVIKILSKIEFTDKQH